MAALCRASLLGLVSLALAPAALAASNSALAASVAEAAGPVTKLKGSFSMQVLDSSAYLQSKYVPSAFAHAVAQLAHVPKETVEVTVSKGTRRLAEGRQLRAGLVEVHYVLPLSRQAVAKLDPEEVRDPEAGSAQPVAAAWIGLANREQLTAQVRDSLDLFGFSGSDFDFDMRAVVAPEVVMPTTTSTSTTVTTTTTTKKTTTRRPRKHHHHHAVDAKSAAAPRGGLPALLCAALAAAALPLHLA